MISTSNMAGRSSPSKIATATLLMASTMTIMAGATIAPSLPSMKAVFAGASNVDLHVRLILTITALSIAISAPFVGILGDKIGRVNVLLGSVVLYVIAGTSGLYLNDLNLLLLGRIILGIAVAGIMTSITGLIGDMFNGPARGQLLGWQGAAGGFGGVIFLGLGGLLATISWRGPFLIYLLPIILVALIPISLRQTETEPPVLSINAGQLASSKIGKYGIYAIAFFSMVSFYALPVQLPFLLVERSHASPLFSGMALAGMALVSAIIGISYGRFAQRFSSRMLAFAACACLAVGMLLIAVSPLFAVTIVGLVFVGLGIGLVMPSLSGWLLSFAPPHLRGKVMGGFASAIFWGNSSLLWCFSKPSRTTACRPHFFLRAQYRRSFVLGFCSLDLDFRNSPECRNHLID